MARRNLFGNNKPMAKEEVYSRQDLRSTEGIMTARGAVDKTFILFAILLLAAVFAWQSANPMWAMVGGIGGLISVVIASFKPHTSPYMAPIVAVFEGLMVGAASYFIGGASGAIVFQATSLTIGVLFLMLMIYKSGLIQVTDKFRMVIMSCMGGIFLVYMLNFILGFFGINVPYLHTAGPIGIGISLFVIVIASLMLLVDFDFIERGEERGAPAYFEWYGAMSIIITLVWIYLEVIRLLAILQRD